MSFWGELKRRNVYKVGVAYAIVAWLLIQGAAIIFPHLNLPSWAVTFLIVFLIIGFPLILLFAWAFEITPEGIKRTKQVPLAKSITHLTGQKLNYIVTGLLVLAVGFLAVKVFFLERLAVETEFVSIEAEQAPVVSEAVKVKKTIAVLPFEDLSPESDQRYFVDGLSEEILNSLTKISDLRVIARTSSFSFKGTNKTVQEIASVLGANHVLEGSVRKAGNALRVTAQLIQAADGTHLWSNTYDRELKDIFQIQEDIASAVASELKATLGIGTSLKQLGGTDNIEAYEHYLFAQGLWNNRNVVDEGNIPTTLKHTLAAIDAALALDHEFALAWAYKALIHYYLLVFGPVSRAGAEQDAAISAALKAIELEPNLADAYHSLGNIQSSRGKFIEAESSYNKGLELTNDSYTFSFIYFHYWAVGYFEKSQKILEKMVLNDPLNQELRGHYLLGLGLLVNMQLAEEEYARGRALFGDEWIWGNACINMLRLSTDHSVSRDEIVFSNPIYDVAKEHLESPEDGLLELRRLYDDSQTSTDLLNIWIWAAYFGDPEFAMDSMEKLLKMNASYFSYCWLPVFREVRQLPRFKELAREFGFVDYWNEFGWPDICRPLENGVFECD